MWDESERFAGGVAKVFGGLLAALGVCLTALSLVTGNNEFFFAFLLLLGVLAAMTLAQGFVAASVGGMLLGISSGVAYCLRRLKKRRSNRLAAPTDR